MGHSGLLVFARLDGQTGGSPEDRFALVSIGLGLVSFGLGLVSIGSPPVGCFSVCRDEGECEAADLTKRADLREIALVICFSG
jgi:hypothetical protein